MFTPEGISEITPLTPFIVLGSGADGSHQGVCAVGADAVEPIGGGGFLFIGLTGLGEPPGVGAPPDVGNWTGVEPDPTGRLIDS